MHLQLQRVSFGFADAAPIVTDATCTLAPGWTGLVGPNGAGKTTLLELFARLRVPSRGHVHSSPGELRVAVCTQESAQPSKDLVAFAQAHDRVAQRLRGALHLCVLERWATLSPGERKRWQLGAALATEPDVLLLDEPTNHLDVNARRWLLGALRLHRGIGLIVSHDRALLDGLTHRTLRLLDATLQMYAGSYSAAREQWELEAEHERQARAAAQTRVRTLGERARHAQDAQRAAATNRRASRRMKGPKDSDARSVLAQTRADWAEARHGRSVEVVQRELSRAQHALAELPVQKQLGSTVFAGFTPAPTSTIGFIDPCSLRAGTRTLLELPGLTLRRDDRVSICGPNGAGKSTLLHLLASRLRLPTQHVLVVPQQCVPQDARRLLGELERLDPHTRGRILTVVASLGVDPARLRVSKQPSPGEAQKLSLAFGFARHVHALILDEPENHLDLASIERLEAALCAYPGALYLVTHDAALAQRCTRQRWRLSERGLVATDLSSAQARAAPG